MRAFVTSQESCPAAGPAKPASSAVTPTQCRIPFSSKKMLRLPMTICGKREVLWGNVKPPRQGRGTLRHAEARRAEAGESAGFGRDALEGIPDGVHVGPIGGGALRIGALRLLEELQG